MTVPSPRGHRGGPSGPPRGEMALAAAACVVLVVAEVVWAVGELAGLVWRGHWPPAGPSAGVAIALRLPFHLGDPAQAWPAPARPDIPGAPAVIFTSVLAEAVASGAVVALGRLRRGRGASWSSGRGGRPPIGTSLRGRWWPAGGRPPGARWANGSDLARLAVRQPGGGRLVLGRAGRRLVATESRHSVLVVGPTQSGKTTGLAVPAILEWDGPVVATSVKADLAGATAGWRRRRGCCWMFDPTGTSGLGPPSGWTPLAEAATWAGAQRMASWLVESTPARSGLSDGAFWFAAAAKLLAPLLLAARSAGATMTEVVRWTDQGDFDEPGRLLAAAGAVDAELALLACAERDERIRSSVATTLETVLSPFEDPIVARSTRQADIDPAGLLAGGGTLYLCGPSYEQARLQGLFAALVSSVVAAAVEAANRSGRPLDPPLLLVLDEAANIAPIKDLDTLASTGAGMGVQLVTICQDLAQLASRYGDDRARTIANNHRAKLVLSGVSDLATLDLVSGLAGEQAVREHTMTADLRDGRRTRSVSVAYRRLAPSDHLRQIPPGTGVLVYGHLPAARLQLRPWFEDRELARRAVGG